MEEAVAAIRVLQSGAVGTDSPAFPKHGQIWIDSTTGYVVKRWIAGTGWIIDNADATVSRTASVDCISFRVAGFTAAGNLTLGVMPTCVVTGAYLLSSAATTSDGSNLYTFQLRNNTQSLSLLSAAKSTNGADLAANVAYSLAPDQNLTLTAGDALILTVTETGTATDLSSAQISLTIFYR
jgi:hypothetical protein